MKKLFTLMMLLVAMTTGAQERKTWDFTKGFSATTIANLQADTENWTDSEGSGRNWAESKARTADTEISCKVNGETWVLPEAKGLRFSAKSAKHLNVVWNGGNNDDTHIWLNGAKAEDAVIIPSVPAGERITVTFSSHGGNDQRGFKVSTAGVADEEGNTTFASGGQSTVVLYNNNTEATDVKLTANVGGMHFYFIQIGDGDAPVVNKLAYVCNGQDDNVLAALKGNEMNDITTLDTTTETISAEALRQYDVVVISPAIAADNAFVSVLKEALPWTPVLNLNARLYEQWGYGQAVEVSPFAVVKDKRNALFSDVAEYVEEGDITAIPFAADAIQGISLGSYFQGDAIPAVSMDDETLTVMHTHNITHNGYIYLPEQAASTADGKTIIQNAITLLKQSKSEITAAAAPAISREYKNLNTNVTITAPNLPKAQVFYTLDGSEPTTESTLYEGTFNVTEETTVKAVAIAEGYTLSSVAELLVEIKSQPKTPTIAAELEDGQTTVSLACETEEAVIWYNFEATTDTLKSSRYTEPFVINMPQNVTAFAVTAGEVWSEPAEQRVLVKNPRVVIHVTAHFDAANWNSWSNGNGLFSWGKSAQSAYEQGEEEVVTDPETGEETIEYSRGPLKEPEVVTEPGDEPKWQVKSYGQSVLWQSNTPSTSQIGTNEGGYYPSVAEDIDPLFPVSKNDIQFYNIYAGEEANASIESTVKYQAPLDIVVLANMQGGPIVAQVSADGEEWLTVGEEIAKTGYSRMWKKYTCMYDGTDEVYVRIAQLSGDAGAKIFDVFVAVAGEESKKLLDELNAELTGIECISTPTTQAAAGIYTLGGTRISQPQRGLNIIVGNDGTTRKVFIK